MKSPCKGVCFYDHEKNHCTTCFRTLEEIGRWWRMTGEEKRKALEGAAKRLATGLENQGR